MHQATTSNLVEALVKKGYFFQDATMMISMLKLMLSKQGKGGTSAVPKSAPGLLSEAFGFAGPLCLGPGAERIAGAVGKGSRCDSLCKSPQRDGEQLAPPEVRDTAKPI
jgi:hypothetical protein